MTMNARKFLPLVLFVVLLACASSLAQGDNSTTASTPSTSSNIPESLAVLETAACSTTCAATGSRCKEDSGKFQPCCRGDAICVSVGEFAECMPNKQPLAAEVEKGAKQVQCPDEVESTASLAPPGSGGSCPASGRPTCSLSTKCCASQRMTVTNCCQAPSRCVRKNLFYAACMPPEREKINVAEKGWEGRILNCGEPVNIK